jgi:excisionase family DNA binding protein
MHIAEVAGALTIGKTTVYMLLGRGDLPIRAVRVGYHWRVSRRDVMAFCHGELIEEHNNVEAA